MSAESTSSEGIAQSFFVERYRKLRSDMALDIQRKQDKGLVTNRLSAEVIASLLIAAADGLQIQWLLEPHQIDMGAELDALWSTLLRTSRDDLSER
jgi:hypothetical protein